MSSKPPRAKEEASNERKEFAKSKDKNVSFSQPFEEDTNEAMSSGYQRVDKKSVLDIGFGPKGPSHLSKARVKASIERYHPHRRTTQMDESGYTYSKFKRHQFCSTKTGRFICMKPKGYTEITDSEFVNYGIGIVLYFKYLKFMAILFTILTIVSIPAMVLYFHGDNFNNEVVSADEYASLLTMGNLGEGIDACRRANAKEEEQLTLDCPRDFVIGKIRVLYGDLRGACECPAAQQPDPQCPPEYPHFDGEREVKLVPTGDVFLDAACCSEERNADGRADFSDLHLRYRDESCTSNIALDFGGRRCLGLSSCSFSSEPNMQQTMSPVQNDKGDDVCKEDEGEARVPTDDGGFLCQVAFNSTGEIGGHCLPTLNVAAVATCFPLKVSLNLLNLDIQRDTVAIILMLIAVLVIGIFIVAMCFLTTLEKEETDLFNVTSAEDFTIFIGHLPEHESTEQLEFVLQRHLETLLTHSPPVAEHNDVIEVADINFCMDYSEVMGKLKKRGRLLHKLETEEYFLKLMGLSYSEARDCIRDGTLKLNNRCCEKIPPEDEEVTKCIRRIYKLIEKISTLDKEITVTQQDMKADRAVSAFVTFVTEEGKLRALREFPDSSFANCCSRKEKMLHDVTMRATGAPSPSDVIWENIPVTSTNRRLRLSATMLVTVLVLIIAAVAVFFTEETSRSLNREFLNVDCKTLIDPYNKELAIQDELPRHDPAKKENSQVRQGRIQCYCQHLWREKGASEMQEEEFLLEFEDGTTEVVMLCDLWFDNYVKAQLASYGSVVIIVTINFLLRAFMKALVGFEKLPNRGAEILSRAMKVFLLALLNTGVLLILVNAYLDSRLEIFRMGTYRDFTAAWYADVGLSLTAAVIINIVIDHGSVIAKMMRKSMLRCWDRGCTLNSHVTRQITQTQLNKLYAGPAMMLDERYARQLAIVFLCLMYCTGIPILLPIAAIYHVVLYYMDKFFFTKVYRTPPRVSNILSNRVLRILPVASVLFLMVSIWMLSNERIFPPKSAVDDAANLVSSFGSLFSGNSTSTGATIFNEITSIGSDSYRVGERATTPATLPLLIIFLLIIIVFLVYHFMSNGVLRVLRFLTCGFCFGKTANQRGRPTYWDSLPVEVLTDYKEGIYKPKSKVRPYYDKSWSSLQQYKEHFDEISSKRQSVQREYQNGKAYLDTLGDELLMKRSQKISVPIEKEKTERILDEQFREMMELQKLSNSHGENPEIQSNTEEVEERHERMQELREQIDKNKEELQTLSDRETTLNHEYDALQEAIASQKEEVQRLHEETARLYKLEQSAKTKLLSVGQGSHKRSARRMTGLHSYAMKDNDEYGNLFGYTASIKDPRLRLETTNASQSVYELQQKLHIDASKEKKKPADETGIEIE